MAAHRSAGVAPNGVRPLSGNGSFTYYYRGVPDKYVVQARYIVDVHRKTPCIGSKCGGRGAGPHTYYQPGTEMVLVRCYRVDPQDVRQHFCMSCGSTR